MPAPLLTSEAAATAPAGMHPIDWSILATYAVVVLVIGIRAGRGQNRSVDLHLGGRNIPIWAAFLSMVATELSAATFIGVPQAGYQTHWGYLQLAFGNLLAKWLLSRTFIPRYRELDVVTVYGFLRERFGPLTQKLAAWYFLVGRLLASGVRLFIGALAFSVATGTSVEGGILIAGTIGTAYTIFGGIRAVIWTDTLQGSLFMIAALASVLFFVFELEGGLPALFDVAGAAGKTQIFHWPPIFTAGTSGTEVLSDLGAIWQRFVAGYLATDTAFPVAMLFGFVLTFATHGTDQDMVQRLLTTRTAKGGSRALVLSALMNFPLTLLFLAIGTGLWAFYQGGLGSPTAAMNVSPDQVFPFFVLHEMPPGLRGLIFAGLFAAAMSSTDSALNALASTWAVDIRGHHSKAKALEDEERDPAAASREVLRMRWSVFCFGLLLMLAALLFVQLRRGASDGASTLVVFALVAMTVLYGALLGVFLVGMFSKRGSERSAICGLIVGGFVGLVLFLQPQWLPYLLGDEEVQRVVPGFWGLPIAAFITWLVVRLGPPQSGEMSRVS